MIIDISHEVDLLLLRTFCISRTPHCEALTWRRKIDSRNQSRLPARCRPPKEEHTCPPKATCSPNISVAAIPLSKTTTRRRLDNLADDATWRARCWTVLCRAGRPSGQS